MHQLRSLYAEGGAAHEHPLLLSSAVPTSLPSLATMSSPNMSSSLCPRPPGLELSSITSDLVFPFRPQQYIHVEGVLHASDSTGVTYPRNYWINPVDCWPQAIHRLHDEGFDTFTFTEFSSPDKWLDNHPDEPLRHDSITLPRQMAR